MGAYIYGYCKPEELDDGFMMPLFVKEQGSDVVYFQRINSDGTITLIKLDLENDSYDPIEVLDISDREYLDVSKRVYVFLDDNEDVYVGNKEDILSKCNTFKAYEKYKDSFEVLRTGNFY